MKAKHIIPLTLLLLLFGLTSCHKFRHLPPEERANKLVEYLKEELELTESQYKELQSIKERIINRHKETRKPPFWFNEKFLSQLENGTIDKEEIKKEVKDFHTKLLENRLKDIDEIYPFLISLSPEQRKKLVELIQEHKEHFKKHHKYP